MPDWSKNYYNHTVFLLFNIQHRVWNSAPCLICLSFWRLAPTKKLNGQHWAQKWRHVLMNPSYKVRLKGQFMYFYLLLQSRVGWKLQSQNSSIFPSLLHVDECGKRNRSMMSWILILQLELFPLHCITKLFYCWMPFFLHLICSDAHSKCSGSNWISEVKEGGLPCVVPSSPMRHFIALIICSATAGHIDVAYTALWEWVRKKSTRSLHKQNKAWMSFELAKQQIPLLTTAGVRTCRRMRMFH